MSQNELLEEYRSGKLSRRSFVRGMTALGLSIAAANHLADRTEAANNPAPGPHSTKKHPDDIYDHHHHHGHKPKKPAAVPVTTLPSTGDGSVESGAASSVKALGIVGTAAAAAAMIFRRGTRTAPENE
jgi:hypothetical protein